MKAVKIIVKSVSVASILIGGITLIKRAARSVGI